MFKFLKEKLKSSIQSISKKIEDEGKDEIIEIEKKVEEKPTELKKEPVHEKKGFFAKLKEKFSKKEEIKEKEAEEETKIAEDVKLEEGPKKQEIPDEKERKEEEQKEDVFEEEKQEEIKEEKLEEQIEKKEIPKTEKQEKAIELKEEVEEVDYEVKEETEKKETVKDHEPEADEPKERKQGEIKEKPEDKKGFFGILKEKIITKKINNSQFEEIFWSLETTLLENNVAVEVIDKIKDDLKKNLVDKPIRRNRIQEEIEHTLKISIQDLFDVEKLSLIEKIKEKKPFVICFVGINGSGKTTTIAKIAHLLKEKGLKCILAAADTFRAASIEQLQQHAERIGIKLIKHDYGSDPAAVAFDAIKHAKSKDVDVVLIDTAGRMHSNQNLMDELKKVARVANPDLTLFVGESITGNDCVDQVKLFNESIKIDGIILTKSDIDEKGGAAISVSYVTKKPIVFLGIGQEYSDLKEFDPKIVIDSIGLEG